MVGNTHSGWSLARHPTGKPATRSTPAARSIAASPIPESMSRCADSMAPADSTIRSAVAAIGPGRPDRVDADGAGAREPHRGHSCLGEQR